MPAKRSPKKSRKPSSTPSPGALTPPVLDALTVAPAAPAAPAGLPASPQAETPPPPKAGPPSARDARLAGRGQRAVATRRYAFRRS